jgi:hypothetical protein
MKCHRFRLVKAVEPNYKVKSYTFHFHIFDKISFEGTYLAKLVCSDEATFYLSRTVNKSMS